MPGTKSPQGQPDGGISNGNLVEIEYWTEGMNLKLLININARFRCYFCPNPELEKPKTQNAENKTQLLSLQ